MLPDLALPTQQLVDPMSRGALDSLENFRDGKESIACIKRGENQMDMIWHDYGCIKVESLTIPPKATFKCQAACRFRQYPAMVS